MKKNSAIIPNDATLRYYFYFMQERMNMFWRKCEGKKVLTDDPILREYKFTNVYRACDRVSQYLISQVIYKDIDNDTPEDTILKILIFKIFNKPSTWEYILQNYGDVKYKGFDSKKLSTVLTKLRDREAIFNNAYIMTGSSYRYQGLQYKHERWLQMVSEEFLDGGVLNNVLRAKSLEDIFNLLSECSFIGDFLAYQYAIDFNYSPYLNYSENSFVKAGIGAIRGITKCFISHGGSYEDSIRYIQEHQDELRKRYGYTHFRSLPSHEPTLIDLQNCFCETDKYLRAKMPELLVGNVRIKQHYKETPSSIDYEFPPKWNITAKLHSTCIRKPIQELTLF